MSSSDLAISIQGLSKAYTLSQAATRRSTFGETISRRLRHPFARASAETFWALDDVSFDVKRGEVVGIIGRNGAGKSTLLKVLSRITEPTSGRVKLYGRIGSLLEVGTGFHPELTGRENIYLNGAVLGMTRKEISRQFDAIVDFAEVERFLDTPVKRYSSGMYVRLAFAVAAHLNPEILVVDEVLAVGDAEFQNKCLGKMKNVATTGRTVLFVSHNMAAVKALCSSAVFMVSGKVQTAGGTEQIIRDYLSLGAGDVFKPERGPVQRVKVFQDKSEIVVEADWSHSEPLRMPSLGFVICDYMGAPVAGSNPYLAGIDKSDFLRSRGRITARMSEPRLLDGKYFLSIWFGDGARDFVEMPKCASFDVRGMAGARQSQAAIVGSVAACCKFSFDEPLSCREI